MVAFADQEYWRVNKLIETVHNFIDGWNENIVNRNNLRLIQQHTAVNWDAPVTNQPVTNQPVTYENA